MPPKKKATKRRAAVKRGMRKAPKPSARPYVMPKTAAELGIVCAECGAPAEWFDAERASKDHLHGFICSAHPRNARSEKLLVK